MAFASSTEISHSQTLFLPPKPFRLFRAVRSEAGDVALLSAFCISVRAQVQIPSTV